MSRLIASLLKEHPLVHKIYRNSKPRKNTFSFTVPVGKLYAPHNLVFPNSSRPIIPKHRVTKVINYEFHTSSRRYIGPHIWIVIKTALKGASMVTGRQFRKWHKSLSHHEKRRLTEKHWKEILLGIAATIGVGYLVGQYHYKTHLQVAPVTGRTRFIAFNDEQFKRVIDFEAEQFNAEIAGKILPVTHHYYRVVKNIMVKLFEANTDIKEVEEQIWTVIIVDDPNVNAQVLPNGNVYVNTGLMEFVSNADELAMVLGHEMAHAILKHAAENLSKVQWVDYFVIMLMALLWAFIPTDGISIITQWFFHRVVHFFIHMPYNRFLEEEADKVGLELAAKACFDIRNGTVFWRVMELKEAQQGKISEFLSTHPASDKRADRFDHFIPRYLEMMKKCNCPPLPSTDPRQIIPHLKSHVENNMLSKKTAANIERLKIPISQYGRMTTAALTNNQTFEPDETSTDGAIVNISTENPLSPRIKLSEYAEGDNSETVSSKESIENKDKNIIDKTVKQELKKDVTLTDVVPSKKHIIKDDNVSSDKSISH